MIKLTLKAYAIRPTLKHRHDIGLDLYAPFDVDVSAFEPHVIKTGYMVAIPVHQWLKLGMKSGVNDWVIMAGDLDPLYEGEIGVKVLPLRDMTISAGTALCHAIIMDAYSHEAYTEIDGNRVEARENGARFDSGGLWEES